MPKRPIDSAVQTLEACIRQGNQWVLLGTFVGEDVVQVPPFDAIELELSGVGL